MGRPTGDRTVNIHLKLSPAENELLEKCVAQSGKKKTDVVVKGIALVYKELTKK